MSEIKHIFQARGDVLIPDSENGFVVAFVGTTGSGRSMLSRLTDTERHEWHQWMQDNPGANGMDWPGWGDAAIRGLSAKDARVLQTETRRFLQGTDSRLVRMIQWTDELSKGILPPGFLFFIVLPLMLCGLMALFKS